MARVNTYLTFDGTCEEAFAFYKEVFGTEYSTPIMRMGEMPPIEGQPATAPEEADHVLHVAMPILGGHILMGSDVAQSRGQVVKHGNSVEITLMCDDVDQLNHLYFALAEGALTTFGPTDMFWGDEYATVTDRYGTNWMLVAPREQQTNGSAPA